MKFSIIAIIILLIISSCENSNPGIPKPRAYPRIDFPEKVYKLFSNSDCGYEFEIPVYGDINQEKKYFDEAPPNDCWYNLEFPAFNGTLYLTYYPINNRGDFDKLIDDTYRLVNKHNIKATGRNEIPISQNGTGGILFSIEGQVASHTQFFLTDSTQNFIRGSLYFNNKVNVDSMNIIQNFIDKDVYHLVESFKWIKKP